MSPAAGRAPHAPRRTSGERQGTQPSHVATAKELGQRAAQLHRLTHGASATPAELPPLSPRQVEILELIAEGLSNLEIGERLFISEATVKWHVRQILKALGVANRAQAVARVFGGT